MIFIKTKGAIKATITASMMFILLIVANYSYAAPSGDLSYESEISFAKKYLERLQNSDFDYIKEHLDPSAKHLFPDEMIRGLIKYLPSDDPISIELIGQEIRTFDSQWQGRFSFEYQFPEGWAIARVAMNKVESRILIIGVNVVKTPASQREINKFTFSGKSIVHYIILGLAVASPLFILFTIIVCIRTPIPKRKWLWLLFLLVGVGSIGINWTTGQLNIMPLSIQIFGAAAVAMSETAPWIIKASIPLGAIIFWIKREGFIEVSKAKVIDGG